MIDRHYHRYEEAGASLRILIVRFETHNLVWSWMSDRMLLATDPLFQSWYELHVVPLRVSALPLYLKDEGPGFSNNYLITYK